MNTPTIEDVQRRWRFVPKWLKKWLYLDNMLFEIDWLQDQYIKVICEVTGNRLSYSHYSAETVLQAHEDYMDDQRDFWEECYNEENEGVEVEYIEKGTFQGGEEECDIADFNSGDTCIVRKVK